IAVIMNTTKILYTLYNFLYERGIEVAAIIKTINMIERAGITGILNARDIVYERAFDMFASAPFFGNVVGSYGDKYINSFTYPHNLILQLLVEGGIILTLPFIFILIVSGWQLLKSWSKNSYYHA